MLKPEGELLVVRPESQVSESGYFGTVFENMKHEARNLSRCANSGGRVTRRLPRAKRKAVPRSSLRCRLATSATKAKGYAGGWKSKSKAIKQDVVDELWSEFGFKQSQSVSPRERDEKFLG
jgi:hypothetical protein